jgi:nitrite reductase (cytochrome c-552)
MWAGYAFAKDFRQARGYAYMLEDQLFTERQSVPQPGTCLHCHASVYTAMKELGDGDIVAGFEALNQMPYHEAAENVTHPVACIDCHDATTMALRITRPAFAEGIAAYKASQGVTGRHRASMITTSIQWPRDRKCAPLSARNVTLITTLPATRSG